VQKGAIMGFQPGSSFGIQDDRRNGVARLALRGELDLATAPKLEGHLEQVEQDGVRAVVLDLRDLTFVDSTGLHAFLRHGAVPQTTDIASRWSARTNRSGSSCR
jgi:anti-anti-sigma factor